MAIDMGAIFGGAGMLLGGYLGKGGGSMTSGWLNKDALSGALMGGGLGATIGSAFNSSDSAMEDQYRRTAGINEQYMAADRAKQDQLFPYQLQEAQQTAALKGEFMNQFQGILDGTTDISNSPMFASQFGNLRQAQASALKQIEETMPLGGARDRAIEAVNNQYLDSSAKMSGQIQQYVFNMAQQLQIPYTLGGTAGRLDQSGLAALGGGSGEDLDGLALAKLGATYAPDNKDITVTHKTQPQVKTTKPNWFEGFGQEEPPSTKPIKL